MISDLASGIFPITNGGDIEPPDIFSGSPPGEDFVLCRDKYGNPTALYGGLVWDLNPYRMSARRVNNLNFDSIIPSSEKANQGYADEIRHILFCLIYFSPFGRRSTIGVQTLARYFLELRRAARFCYSLHSNDLVGALSLRQLLTTSMYLVAYARENNSRLAFNSVFAGLLNHLASAGEDRVGFKVVSHRDVEFGSTSTQQHPVIPPRIYMEYINAFGDLLDLVSGRGSELESFILKFQDRFYGRKNLKQKQMGVGGKLFFRPTFNEAVIQHNLSSVFVGSFYCSSRKNISSALAAIQYVVKNVIHIYTGMRDQEVLRLKYACISDSCAVDEVVSPEGGVADPARMISVLSTTTKFEGYRKEASWLATSEVLSAIKVAQAICRALAPYYGLGPEDIDELPLLLSPAILHNKSARIQPGYLPNSSFKWSKAPIIDAQDIEALQNTDPDRDVLNDLRFAVGQSWPLSSHQYRRSLAFYASNSGFVSLPSLRTQYKHLTTQMSRYYSNNFEKLTSIFGYYDPGSDDFKLPQTHVALEYQIGVPVSMINQLISEMLNGEGVLMGGAGSYMQKQKERASSGLVWIDELRSESLAKAKRGELSYRPTLAGGCTKVGPCNDLMFGNILACTVCPDSIINSAKLSAEIQRLEAEHQLYDIGSGERQIIRSKLDSLQQFMHKRIGEMV